MGVERLGTFYTTLFLNGTGWLWLTDTHPSIQPGAQTHRLTGSVAPHSALCMKPVFQVTFQPDSSHLPDVTRDADSILNAYIEEWVNSYSMNSSSRYETLVSDIYKKIKLSNTIGNTVLLNTI